MANILPICVWYMFVTGTFAYSQDWYFSGSNIALGKNATQSSDYVWALAGLAVDGNTDTEFGGRSCSHTEHELNNYNASWTVYLNGNYSVSGIIIYNRNEDSIRDRLKNVQVIGDPGNVTLYNDTGKDNYKNDTISITVDGFRTYNSITVWLSAPSGHPGERPILTLCEVEIYAACRPPTVSNGTYDPIQGGYSFGSVITVTCDKGYNIYGSNQSKCQGNGSWGDTNGNSSSYMTTPQCNLITCLWPTTFSGGHYNNTVVSKAPYSTVIHASCNSELYVFTGNRTRTCRDDSMWSGEASTCVALCIAPNVVHGRYEGNGSTTQGLYEQGQQIHITCDDGYKLSTASTGRTCDADHQWIGGDVTCNVLVCTAQIQAGPIIGAFVGGIVSTVVVLVISLLLRRRYGSAGCLCCTGKQTKGDSTLTTRSDEHDYINDVTATDENEIVLESINRNEEALYEPTVPADLKEHVYSDLKRSDPENEPDIPDSKMDYVNLHLNK